jgi:RNA-directed DNA polymerase
MERVAQSSVISPLTLYIALHGLDEAAGVRYETGLEAGRLTGTGPALTRYADGLVVWCRTRQQAGQVQARVAAWLELSGLAWQCGPRRHRCGTAHA